MEFLAGYLIEKSLSMDNLFVFLMLFMFFGIPRKYQHEVLFWGIFGALVLRSVFIFAGAAMVQRFEWILAIFGVFLIYTGIKMFGHNEDEQVDPSKNIFVKVFKRFFPEVFREGGSDHPTFGTEDCSIKMQSPTQEGKKMAGDAIVYCTDCD